MCILGIDQSYTSCGIVVLDTNQQIIHHEIIKSDPTKTIFQRSYQLACDIVKIVEEKNIKYIAMEGLAFGGAGNATRDLAGLQHTIAALLAQKGFDAISFYPPQTVKKFASGTGKAKKPEMFESLPTDAKNIIASYKKTKGRFDITDAYWIARICLSKNF